jgi:hypothetical protein
VIFDADARDEADVEVAVGTFFVVPVRMALAEVGFDGIIEDFPEGCLPAFLPSGWFAGLLRNFSAKSDSTGWVSRAAEVKRSPPMKSETPL